MMLKKRQALDISAENKKLLHELDYLKNIHIKPVKALKKNQSPNKNSMDTFDNRLKKILEVR